MSQTLLVIPQGLCVPARPGASSWGVDEKPQASLKNLEGKTVELMQE